MIKKTATIRPRNLLRKVLVMLLLSTNIIFPGAFASMPSPKDVEDAEKRHKELEKKEVASEAWRLALVKEVQPKFVKMDTVVDAVLAVLDRPQEDVGDNTIFFNAWRDLEVASRNCGGRQLVDSFIEEVISEVKKIPQIERRQRIHRMVEQVTKKFIANCIFYCTYKSHDPKRHNGQALVDRAKEYARAWSELEAAARSADISPMVVAGGICRMANTGGLQPAIVRGMIDGLNTAQSYLDWGRALIRVAVRAKKIGKAPDGIWDEMAAGAIGNTIQDLDDLDVSNVRKVYW
jgi:hypothetical protein